MNDLNEAVRSQAEAQFVENLNVYKETFNKTKKHLPNKFLKVYASHNEFHDYVFQGISLIRTHRNYKIEIQLSNERELFLLEFYEVLCFKIDIYSFKYCILGLLSWGYGEFEIMPDKSIRLSILCDFENELQFQFKNVKVRTEALLGK